MMGNGRMINKEGEVLIHIKMEIIKMVNGNQIRMKGMAFLFLIMEINMKDNGKIIKEMEKESFIIKKEDMKVNIKKI